MSFTTATNSSRFFSVVGAPYVSEDHRDKHGHFPSPSEMELLKTGVTGLWLSFFAAIGISLVSNGQAAKAAQIASTGLQ